MRDVVDSTKVSSAVSSFKAVLTSSVCIYIHTHTYVCSRLDYARSGRRRKVSRLTGEDVIECRDGEREILFGSGCFFVIGAIHDEPHRGKPARQRLALRRLQSGPRYVACDSTRVRLTARVYPTHCQIRSVSASNLNRAS